uniref:Orotidine 5'-phosphate decarboxylase n=1 Tax=Paulinella chromatophora TaxID=39717 RepID=B1X5B1_PAUCH|nr:orotidine 5'-phosphate decarboxylase [Paulinella chromatophora]ACB43130.1 orotidine 5'-phosphate decarboxylase [Paulinella chromatophora]
MKISRIQSCHKSPNLLEASDKIIVALDGMDEREALNFVMKIPQLRWVKVGLELFTIAGPTIISKLREKGLRVFLDLKFHDIPTTMAGACRSAARLGAEMITVHASAGSIALLLASESALEGAKSVGMNTPIILAVTVLTSWDEYRFSKELAINESIVNHVQHLAQLASTAGVGGLVCSPLEVSSLRTTYAKPFALITPGIRLRSIIPNDQERIMTPSQALEAGASQIVIGRPITMIEQPEKIFLSYCEALT